MHFAFAQIRQSEKITRFPERRTSTCASTQSPGSAFPMYTKKLAEKVAIVTGGGQGVGLGIALALATEGASLVLTGRTEAKLTRAAEELSALGSQVLVVPGDTRNRADAVRTVELAVERFGRVDALINNAQSSSPGVPLESVTDDDWSNTLESGLYGTLYFMGPIERRAPCAHAHSTSAAAQHRRVPGLSRRRQLRHVPA